MLICKCCGRSTPTDEISDGPYLASQYGWTVDSEQITCPVCNSGTKVGQRLLNQLSEIRRKRNSRHRPRRLSNLEKLFKPDADSSSGRRSLSS